jgi:GR25 family glycosyltransferase involved in LPS biosynthesis
MSIPVYIISLSSETKRRLNVVSQFNNTQIKPKIIDAIDGRTAHFPFKKYPHLSSTKQIVSHTQLACSLSHLKCWKTFLESEDDYALIVEDDAVIKFERLNELINTPNFNTINFDLLLVNSRSAKHLNIWEATRFSRCLTDKKRNRTSIHNSRLARRFKKIYRRNILKHLLTTENWQTPFVPFGSLLEKRITEGLYEIAVQSAGTDGYIISKKGATKLIQIAKRFRLNYPIDCIIEYHSTSLSYRKRLIECNKGAQPQCLQVNLKKQATTQCDIELDAFIYNSSPVVSLHENSETSTIVYQSRYY